MLPVTLQPLAVRPTATEELRQLGPQFLYFGGAELSELDVLLVARGRETFKAWFNTFLLAIVLSVVASEVTALVHRASQA